MPVTHAIRIGVSHLQRKWLSLDSCIHVDGGQEGRRAARAARTVRAARAARAARAGKGRKGNSNKLV